LPQYVSDPDLTQDCNLTEKGLVELKQRMPFADLTEFSANPEVERILDLYTVDMLGQYVASKLPARPAPAGARRPAGSGRGHPPAGGARGGGAGPLPPRRPR